MELRQLLLWRKKKERGKKRQRERKEERKERGKKRRRERKEERKKERELLPYLVVIANIIRAQLPSDVYGCWFSRISTYVRRRGCLLGWQFWKPLRHQLQPVTDTQGKFVIRGRDDEEE